MKMSNYLTTSFRYILNSIILLLFSYLCYYKSISPFTNKGLLLFILPTLLILTIVQLLYRSSIWKPALLFPLIITSLWGFMYPLTYHITTEHTLYFYGFHRDYVFFLSLYAIYALWHLIINSLFKNRVVTISSSIFILSVSSLFPFLELGYFLVFKHYISAASLFAIYHTNLAEAKGYLLGVVGVNNTIIIALGLFLFLVLTFISSKQLQAMCATHIFTKKETYISLFILIPLSYYSFYQVLPRVNGINNLIAIHSETKALQKYTTNNTAIFNDLTFSTIPPINNEHPKTFILVIGESANRDYMKVFNPQLTFNDTPWESAMRTNNPNFIFFKNAYSSYPQTVPALSYALTEANQYNTKQFINSANIINIAKKAGYTTHWFSNQLSLGKFNEGISVLAHTADNTIFINQPDALKEKLDGALLPLLQQVDPHKNNFIIIHLMGSHTRYKDRYPQNANIYNANPNEPKDTIESYANTIAYTDNLLQSIYSYATKNLNLDAMVYFSDHGEDIELGHMPEKFNYSMVRIPMWIYLSPNYENTHPLITTTLKKHENSYFTNDMLYDTLCGILIAPSNHYEKKDDLSSSSYTHTLETLKTMYREKNISNDPLLHSY